MTDVEYQMPETGSFYSVDGYCHETRTLYEFWVVIFTVIPVAPSGISVRRAVTLWQRYERTMCRIEQIAKAGYKVKIQWECEFDESKIVEEKAELLTHPIIQHSPLKTCDALYGGRNGP